MVDGKVIAAVQEERFTRIKHQTGMPFNSIKFCLNKANISLKDVSYLAYDKNVFEGLKKRGLYWIKEILIGNNNAYSLFKTECLGIIPQIAKLIELKSKMNEKSKLFFVSHHLSHISSSYFSNNIKSSALLSIDFMGELASTWCGVAKKDKIEEIFKIDFPHSLGILYTAITEYLGFEKLCDEYKIMGLASYGKPTFSNEMNDIVILKLNGKFELNLEYFNFHRTLGKTLYVSDKFINIFGMPRKTEEKVNQRHADIAASLQYIMEKTVLHILKFLRKNTKKKVLCYGGGVSLNCKINSKIAEANLFDKILIHPAADDSGNALGVCYYVNQVLLKNSKIKQLNNIYLGPEFQDIEIEKILKDMRFDYIYLVNNEKTIQKCVKDLYRGKVVGWFQGGMEWGPRALGNRSILADPSNRYIVDLINDKIKNREKFRPFAPSVLKEHMNKYFYINSDSEFMLFLFDAKNITKEKAPAIVHVDGTSRVQSVDKKKNYLYWNLINEFYRLKGVPILLNTSLNVRGEPIVNSPNDALKLFSSTNLDVLYLNNFRIVKSH